MSREAGERDVSIEEQQMLAEETVVASRREDESFIMKEKRERERGREG